MKEETDTVDRVPNTNSPTQSDSDNGIGPYHEEQFGRERYDWATYNHADVRYNGEKWDQTTNSEGVYGSSARTTFRSFEAPSSDEQKYDDLWTLQMGFGQTYEDGRNKRRVRDDTTWKLCDAVLQQCEVPDRERYTAIRNVLRRDLQGFSGHYSGADGACVGFALMELCDCPEAAEDCWVADRAVDVLPHLDRQEVEALISYVFDDEREYN